MGLLEFTCRCEKKFCRKCSFPEVHKCEFDIKTCLKEKLKERLIKVEAQKVIPI
jgi:hypothetical protein